MMQLDLNKVYFLYNGNKINEELSFEELANEEDKSKNQINIALLEINNNNIIINEELKKPKEITCLKCQENIFIKIEDIKIGVYSCIDKNKIEDININDLKNKLDILNIVCNNCNKAKNNIDELYICKECNKYYCCICKPIHDKSHLKENNTINNINTENKEININNLIKRLH